MLLLMNIFHVTKYVTLTYVYHLFLLFVGAPELYPHLASPQFITSAEKWKQF